jgi:hypothetical protein
MTTISGVLLAERRLQWAVLAALVLCLAAGAVLTATAGGDSESAWWPWWHWSLNWTGGWNLPYEPPMA